MITAGKFYFQNISIFISLLKLDLTNSSIFDRHFNEHQTQINNELLPLTDRLNQLKMRLQIKETQNDPLSMLKMWRDKKYEEIDREYNRKIRQQKQEVS
ncbi:unnamed protein product [Rotaria sordida]|uniref:Uncharacterized protein n=1 Tax=Rotaria sordida TaxID=392033 RepID=A0A814GWB1_9BILA|nr:unnamed protein product [Rotaria sordida]